ncbi:ClC family H(+)/Cl(-) exchange transporter [Streptococcus himalayensis]|uniref:Ribonuclease HII n=1 Tax=Streptococcus himalayensis TaxID=1888195 RepID=A0A917A542_9STRE|nr:ClC family H(+)/Cl(-) exchange transporter [Streptococcus himalayensis]GGE28168.1 ribonuclease HII [Streptococcus himalayensis]
MKSGVSNSKKEFAFLSSSIIGQVVRGILVGLVVGGVVGSFRLLIEKGFHIVQGLYLNIPSNPIFFGGILGLYAGLIFLAKVLLQSEKDIKGSGIPQIEAELKGLMSSDWWSVLWKKYVLGVVSIASGLMLGREGPSIQLGAMTGKGVAKQLQLSPVEERSLIASGAAAGLAAAFNAPIAGLLFVVEEIYHHFSRFFWVSTLAASLTANVVSLWIFGLDPVLDMPDNLPALSLGQYWLLIGFGLFLGLAGFIYEKVILRIGDAYAWIGAKFHLSAHFYPAVASLLIVPIGILAPQLLGGGHQLILSLTSQSYLVSTLLLYVILRFVWSMVSYGSGLPGGIFLPMLTLGALLGAIFGSLFFTMGVISQQQIPIFIILGMSGYFGAISKAPLTAMILVTEMVGDIRNLMPLGLVTLVAYIVMDLLKGTPIYEAMLEKMLPEQVDESGETTLIEIPVSEKIAGKQVHELDLPRDILITMQIHQGKSQTVNGSTHLYLGDMICLVIPKSQIGAVKDLLL